MIEISKKELLRMDNKNKVRVLKYIIMGLIKYKGVW